MYKAGYAIGQRIGKAIKPVYDWAKCLLGFHDWHFSFSFKTGDYATHCTNCGKEKR